MTFAVAVGLFTLGGWWVDQRLGTRAVFLILGFLLGAAGGMLHLLSRVAPDLLPFGKDKKKKDGAAGPGDPKGPES